MKRSWIGLSCLLAGALSGQVNKVIPAGTTYQDGDTSTPFFSGYGAGRVQQIAHGGALSWRSALLRELHLRADGPPPLVWLSAHSLTHLNLWLGYTSVTPQTMSTVFANNRTGAQTQLFSGQYNLPAQDTISRPFNIVWKFPQPFLYTYSSGHLLVEFEVPVPVVKTNYFFDAHRMNPTVGSTEVFGTSGTFSSSETYRLSVFDHAKLLPGGNATFTAAGFSKSYPALAIFGFSNQQYGPLPLPFDLAPLGAPGNSLYASMDLVLPMPMTNIGPFWEGRSALPIPQDPLLAGFRFFAQGIFADAAANQLGLVFSPGLVMSLALGALEAEHVGTADYTAANGSLMGSAIVMEFTSL